MSNNTTPAQQIAETINDPKNAHFVSPQTERTQEEVYTLSQHNLYTEVGCLVGELLELIEVLPAEQAKALKKIAKRTVWDWKDRLTVYLS